MPVLPPIDAGAPTLGIVSADGIITAKRRTKGGMCFNHALIVVEDEHRVYCKKCEKRFEPIEALVYLASHPDRYMSEYQHLVRQTEQKGKELTDLERRIRNARATIRRLDQRPTGGAS